jgi:hypothetical protein
VHGVGILRVGAARNLAFRLDGTAIFANATAGGCVLLPGFSAGTDGMRRFR